MNTVLLHTKKQQLMSVLADRFYRQEKNTELMVDILGHAVECRSGEGGTHMTHVILVTGLLLQCLVGKTDRYHLEREDIEAIRMASGLHDIGKLQIPEEILTKPHSLTPEEYEIVKRHTQIGAKLITDLPIYQNERLVKYAIEICRWHHERWNGEGYPDGLKGDAIPIAAQVVSVADVYDALYRAAQAIKSQIRSDDELVRYGAMNSSCCSATCRSRSWRRNCSPSAPRLTRSSSRSILNRTSARASAARSRRDAS